MIQMKWRADSENSENSALDTIIVTHKIYEKKYFLIGLTLLRRIEQLNTLLVYQVYILGMVSVNILYIYIYSLSPNDSAQSPCIAGYYYEYSSTSDVLVYTS